VLETYTEDEGASETVECMSSTAVVDEAPEPVVVDEALEYGILMGFCCSRRCGADKDSNRVVETIGNTDKSGVWLSSLTTSCSLD
jgi:hypothetical protein